MEEDGALQPGWYPDQTDPTAQRYWDGTAWGSDVRRVHPDAISAPSDQQRSGWTDQGPSDDSLATARKALGEQPVKPTGGETLKALAVVTVVVLVVGGLLWTWIFGSEDDGGDPEINVSVVCEQWVEERLRSPGSAEFEQFPDQQIVEVDSDTYRVRAWVDSQNGFGAVLRTDYTCTASMVVPDSPGGDWRLDNLDLAEG